MTVRRMALNAAVGLFALGLAALAMGLAYLGGWALARAIESARALAVPLVACATHKRHTVLSRRKAGRTAMPTATHGVQNWTPAPALEPTTPPVLLPLLDPEACPVCRARPQTLEYGTRVVVHLGGCSPQLLAAARARR